ncbi:MAG: hypothetical protein KBE77_02085 [Aliarcobacter sp.]|nr:hypothetical protein [Aliarcobacter sp.]
MLAFTPTDKIKSLFIDVSEEIENKNLKKFIFTSLKLNNFEINKNDFIHINFISELKQYQVLVFPKEYKNAIFQIFELFYLDKNDLDTFDLYFTNEFFCLYKNGNFYYFQNIESQFEINELVDYINKKFMLKIDNYKIIDNLELEELKNSYLEKNFKNRVQNFNKKDNYGFKIYLVYLIVILVSFLFFLENKNETKNSFIAENEFDKLKKDSIFSSFSVDFDFLIKLLQKHNLNLKSLEYKESRIKTTFYSTSKPDIYSLFEELKDRLISQEINYLENEKIYEAIIYVK